MIHVYLSAKTSRIKNFHVVRAVKNSIRWRKQNSTKRIVATEKLQELNLQSQSEFSEAAEISKMEWYALLFIPIRDTMCRFQDIPLHSGGTSGTGKVVSADHESP
jgi:hypothetical protein